MHCLFVHRRFAAFCAALLITLVPLARFTAAGILYRFTDLGTLGGSQSQAYAINDGGQIVGEASNHLGQQHAFLYNGGVMSDLGTLGGSASAATWINDAGEIVGYSTISNTDQTWHVFTSTGGPLTDLKLVSQPSGTGDPHDVSVDASGHIAFRANDHAMLYSAGLSTDLGTWGPVKTYEASAAAITPDGRVVGWADGGVSGAGTQRHAFLYSGGKNIDLGTLGGNLSFATAINASGQVAGYSNSQSNIAFYHAFLYSHGSMSNLGSLVGPQGESFAEAMNDAGVVVGYSDIVTSGAQDPHAFIDTPAGMTDLNSQVSLPGGWVLVQANGINDEGQIVGWGRDAAGDIRAFLLTPVPEPAGLCLLLLLMLHLRRGRERI